MEAKIYNQKGGEAGKIELPAKVFAAKWRADLVHQVVEGMRSNKRSGTADTKDRGEVRGGGKKPWKQKGTGRARHGSSRSPIWVGGGVTHGPLAEKNYKRKISKSMRAQALFSVLSKKYAAGQVLFVSELALAAPKTAEARAIMTNLGTIAGFEEVGTRRKNALYVVLPKMDVATKKSFQNMGNVLMGTVSTLNPVDVLSYKYLVLVAPEESVKALEAKLAK